MNKGRNLNPNKYDGFRNFCWYSSRGEYLGDNVISEGLTYNIFMDFIHDGEFP